MGWLVNSTPRPLYPRELPGTHCTGAPGPFWTGAENLQLVASRSTSYAIPAHIVLYTLMFMLRDMKWKNKVFQNE
jgi:hypothetical protein